MKNFEDDFIAKFNKLQEAIPEPDDYQEDEFDNHQEVPTFEIDERFIQQEVERLENQNINYSDDEFDDELNLPEIPSNYAREIEPYEEEFEGSIEHSIENNIINKIDVNKDNFLENINNELEFTDLEDENQNLNELNEENNILSDNLNNELTNDLNMQTEFSDSNQTEFNNIDLELNNNPDLELNNNPDLELNKTFEVNNTFNETNNKEINDTSNSKMTNSLLEFQNTSFDFNTPDLEVNSTPNLDIKDIAELEEQNNSNIEQNILNDNILIQEFSFEDNIPNNKEILINNEEQITTESKEEIVENNEYDLINNELEIAEISLDSNNIKSDNEFNLDEKEDIPVLITEVGGKKLPVKSIKSFSLILYKTSMDLSNTTIVDNNSYNPELKLVPKIQGWKPIPSVYKAQGNIKKKQCPLCQASYQQHQIIWHAYGVAKDIAKTITTAQEQGVLGVDPKIVKSHFASHPFEQPAPLKKTNSAELLELANKKLTAREREIILAVYRQRVLNTRQIADLFFAHTNSNDDSARKSSYRTLHKLRYMHMLFQYQTIARKSAEQFYFTGRHAVSYLEQQEKHLVGNPYTIKNDDVKEFFMEHDINSADVFIKMRKQLYTNRTKDNMVKINNKNLELVMDINSWWGSRSLQFEYLDPIKQIETKLSPDGFASFSLNDGKKMEYKIPFYYEWDSGNKDVADVVDQLSNYMGFYLAQVTSKRFPQLKIEDYMPSVLVVTSSIYRVNQIKKLTQEKFNEWGYPTKPNIYITDQNSLNNSAWKADTFKAITNIKENEEKLNIAEHLILDAKNLNESQPINPKFTIEIDLQGAKPNFIFYKK